MSASTEHTGLLEPRRLLACIVLIVIVLGASATVSAQCTSPTVLPPVYRDNGIVTLQWVHPNCFADTVRAHTGAFTKPFFISDDTALTDNRVALKLPPCSTATLLHTVRSYFIGKTGVSQYEWSIKAAFTWTLCADSDGVPGGPLYPSVTSPIGESDSLLHGRWFEQPVNWWLPDSTTGGVWLVGRWPELARKVVRLGASASNCPLPLQLGYNDGTGLRWEAASDPGLLIEMEILHSRSTTNDTLSSTAGFLVVRELLSGAMSPRSDTAILRQGDPFIWNDSLSVVGQTLRYRVAAPCSSGDFATTWTSELAIPARWPVGISPESLSVPVRIDSDTICTLSIGNNGPDTLSVGLSVAPLAPAEAAVWKRLESLPILIASPDFLILPPGANQVIVLRIPINDLYSGSYETWLIARLTDTDSLHVERRAVRIRLDVDFQTSVADLESDRPDQTAFITAGPNPFSDVISLEWQVSESSESSGEGSSVSASFAPDAVEVIVYNSLGNIVTSHKTRSSTGVGRNSDRARITITGTRDWPSGVYLVSLRRGSQARTVKLLHLK